MRLVFLDDEPEKVEWVIKMTRELLDAESVLATTVEEAVAALHEAQTDLVVFDVFLPLGAKPGGVLGRRARKYAEKLDHLGGLVFMDELERVEPAPKSLLHTACNDFALLELLGEVVDGRVPKPAPPDVLLAAVLETLGFPAPR